MDFGADESQLTDLAGRLEGKAGELENIISSIYSRLEGLNGNGWSGKGYDQFMAECNAYKGALQQIPGVIRDFANFFSGKAATNANELANEAENGKKQAESA